MVTMSIFKFRLQHSVLLTVFLCYLSSTYANSIISPAADSAVIPGTTLTAVVKRASHNQTSKTLALSFGLSVYNESLGRPYIGSFDVLNGAAKWNEPKSAYEIQIAIPPADKFIDGFTRKYSFVATEYFLEGPDNNPTIVTSNTPVTVKTS